MFEFLNKPGFLGTHATNLTDLTLILIVLTAVLFTIGLFLARAKKIVTHRWVQTITASINAIVVLGVMINSFFVHILPGIPEKLFEGSYGVTTLHALIGLFGLLLGILVVMRGNGLVPKGLKFTNYKLYMRLSYSLYMLATLIGAFVYYEAFIIGI
jgi:uncharacterized membrane protein YozB (DUF420 family)